MSGDEEHTAKGRNWHKVQEVHLFEKMVSAREFRPVAGSLDGQMANKTDELWVPLAAYMNKENPKLIEEIKKQSPNFNPKVSFAADAVQSKWKAWQTKYREMKSKFNVGDRIKVGETGLAAEDETKKIRSAQPAIDKATAKWHLFGRFHAEFGNVARFAVESFTTDSMTPAKKPLPSPGEEPSATATVSKKKKVSASNSSKKEDEEYSVEEVSADSGSPKPAKKRARKFTSRQMDAVMAIAKEKSASASADMERFAEIEEKNRAALREYGLAKSSAAEKLAAQARIQSTRMALMKDGMSIADATKAAVQAENDLQQELKAMQSDEQQG